MSLAGTTVAPHFDREAFRVERIYATLVADGRTANLSLTPNKQEFKALLAPEAFVPVDNAWGKQGWTTVILERMTTDELRAAFMLAHAPTLPANPER